MDSQFNANDVISDLAEQVKQLSLNNTILRAMLKAAQAELQGLRSPTVETEESN